MSALIAFLTSPMTHAARSMATFMIVLGAFSFGNLARLEAQGLDNNQGPVEISDGPVAAPAAKVRSRNSGTTQPIVGRKAASKYMGAENAGVSERSTASSGGNVGDHYLALHLGGYVSDNAYLWGKDEVSNVGKLNMGVTYRMGEWVNSMDLALRIDLSTFNFDEGKATKLSFLPVVMFPDATSRFPLYFGLGAGAGVFINQIAKESPLSLDYQILVGMRFFEVINDAGFFIEAGLKNHLLLLSDGQYNGTFVALGTVFTF